MIAAHFENLLFLLLIAVAVLFQLLARAVSKDQTKRKSTPAPGTPPPIPRVEPETDQERIRKFLQALGQPPTSRPPPRVAPRTDIPPRPLAPVQPPPGPFSLPRGRLIPGPRRKRDVILHETLQTAPPAFEVQEAQLRVESPLIGKTSSEAYAAAPSPVVKRRDSKTEMTKLLGSKSGLREAIILREVFGPPRSLQPLDLIAS